MAESDKTTIEVTKGQKEAVKTYQKRLMHEFGTEPTQGETIAIAVERCMGGSA